MKVRYVITRFFLFAVPAALTACSLSSSKDDNPSLFVDLSGLKSHSYSLLNGNGLFGTNSLIPTSVTGFQCYGVNVTGPGIPDSSNHPDADPQAEFNRAVTLPDRYCAYRGVVTPPLHLSANATDVSLSIPPGAIRLVQIVGVNDAAVCASGTLGDDGDGAGGGGGDSRYFEIGRSVVTNLFQDQSVNVNLNWPTGNTLSDALDRQKRAMDCGDGNCGSFYSLGLAASVSATPTPLTFSSPLSEVAQRLPTVAGTYIRRVTVPFGSNVGTNITAKIYEDVSGSGAIANLGAGTVYASTQSISTNTATSTTFDFYQAGYGYLQMVSGRSYWIVFTWTVNASPVLSTHAFNASATGGVASFQQRNAGGTWSQVPYSTGIALDAYGCGQ